MRNYKFKGKNDNNFSSGVCTTIIILCDATTTFGGDNHPGTALVVVDAGNTTYRPLETRDGGLITMV